MTDAPVVAGSGNFLSAGRAVSAGRGWAWIVEGWALFQRAPGPWIAITVVGVVILVALSMVPVLGQIALTVLTPVFTAGLMLGCRSLQDGGTLEVPHLIGGFRERFGSLAAVGAIYLVAALVIALAVGLMVGTSLFSMFADVHHADPEKIAAAAVSVLLALLAMAALMIPVIMAIWFAPCLVVFHGQGAMDSMRGSFIACLKNTLPFLLYGLVLLVPAILATLPFALGWLVLGPVVPASVYTAYRDIFFS